MVCEVLDASCGNPMRKFDLQINGNVRSSLSEDEVSELYCDGSITRNTLCRTAGEKNWRTRDELLPSLKYGVNRPVSKALYTPVNLERNNASGATITDVQLPFGSVFRLMLQIIAVNLIISAGIAIVALIFWLVFGALLFGTFASGLNATPRAPEVVFELGCDPG